MGHLERWFGAAFPLPQQKLRAVVPVVCSHIWDMRVFSVPEQWFQSGGRIPGRRIQILA
jgi:hypothetical protein